MAVVDCGVTTFGVHRGAWADPELVAMVAPPVTVSSFPIGRPLDAYPTGPLARAREILPVGKDRQPAR
jgi:hypothetical protein